MNSQSAIVGMARRATWPITSSGSREAPNTALLSARKRCARSARL